MDRKIVFRQYNKDDISAVDKWFDKDTNAQKFLSLSAGYSDIWGSAAESVVTVNKDNGFEQINLTKKEIKQLSPEQLQKLTQGKKFQVKNMLLEINEKPVGCIIVEVKNNILKINFVFVNPQTRGHKFAKCMIQKIIEQPKSVGIVLPFETAVMNIYEDNRASRNLAKSLGFFLAGSKDNLMYYHKQIQKEKEAGD